MNSNSNIVILFLIPETDKSENILNILSKLSKSIENILDQVVEINRKVDQITANKAILDCTTELLFPSEFEWNVEK